MKTMKNKRGVSPAISWILLTGLAVALGGMVTIWMKSTAESSAETLKSKVEMDIRCDEISLNAYDTPSSINCSNLTIINKGLFSIYALKIRYDGQTSDHDLSTQPLSPGKLTTIVLNIPTPITEPEIGLIPLTNLENEEIACLEKEIIVACNQ